MQSRFTRSLRVSILPIICTLITVSAPALAQESGPFQYDSRFEISLGGEARLLSSSADWSSERYGGGFLKVAMNLFAGLGIEYGRGFAYGEYLDRDAFEYGAHRILNGALNPAIYSSFFGLRYTIPSQRIRPQGLFSTNSIQIGAGMVWDRFYIRSDEYWYYTNAFGWQSNDTAISNIGGDRKDTAADIDGYYVSLAGRWRLDQQEAAADGGNGQYGIDAGIRYLVYTDSQLAQNNLDEVPDNLSGAQVFVSLFVGLDLFY